MIACLVIAIVVIACLAALRWSVRLQGGPPEPCELLSVDLRSGEVRVDGLVVTRSERADAGDTRLHATLCGRAVARAPWPWSPRRVVVEVAWQEGGVDHYVPALCVVHERDGRRTEWR